MNKIIKKSIHYFSRYAITVFSCVLIIVLGITFLTQANPDPTTIGENISTTNLTATGDLIVDTDTFYVDASGDKVGIGTATPSAKLDIDPGTANAIDISSTLDQDNQKGIILTVAADTDGDDVYGIYNTVGVGTGVLATADRNAYGVYNAITSAGDTDAGYLYHARPRGIYNTLDATANLSTYAETKMIQNEMPTYSGDIQSIFGIDNTLRIGGASSYGLANSSHIYLKNDDGIAQTGFGVYTYIKSAGTSDTFYGTRLQDYDTDITGGTVYGTHIDLDDANWDDAWSIYVESGSADSYFGSNVGIGTATPDTALEVDGIIQTTPTASRTCNAAAEGGIMYDSDDNHFYGCNGSAWVQLDN